MTAPDAAAGGEREAGGREPTVKRVFDRRVVPVLLAAQLAYVALFGLLFALSGPDTGEIDHTAPSATDDALFTGALLAMLLLGAGGAVLLGWEKARTRTPPAARSVWLGVLALGEIAVAVAFLDASLQESFGPDTVVAGLAVAASAAVTLTCATEIRARPRRTARGRGGRAVPSGPPR
ncbi:hypothetical protein OG524_08665 [Streptomyces sp. NBC_01520]|uniref:hypothetical protein n=1 Tax=Streptomyces sp. NBC_01520 TaxID=2903892 RepID=UPI003868444F